MTIRIGTRGSRLAVRQTEIVAGLLKSGSTAEMQIDVVKITTKGDKLKHHSLESIGGQGVFVKEIESALLRGEIDVAVHSLKDMPVKLPEGLQITATPTREDPRDVLVSRGEIPFEHLPKGAKIGTGSLRRAFQLKQLRPDIEIIPIRGNIETRIAKTKEQLDGVILAAAGIKRLGLENVVATYFSAEDIIPAPGQGTLAIESKKNDVELSQIINSINHQDTMYCALAERAFLEAMGAGCHTPVGAIGRVEDTQIVVTGFYGLETYMKKTITGPKEMATAIGAELGRKIQEVGCI